VFSFPGSRFPGFPGIKTPSFPGKRERVKDNFMLSTGSSFTDFNENQLAKVQLFTVDFHENHKFVQFTQY